MKILLVYPEYPPTFWSFKYIMKFIAKKAAYPPLGLLTVAAMLPREWRLRLVDMNIEKLGDDDLSWADYVMVSAMSVQKRSVLDILQRCRRLGVKVVAGGPLFTSTPEEYVDLAEHLVLNEAELTLPSFLADLNQGAPKKIYRTEEFPSLSFTPVPRWDLLSPLPFSVNSITLSLGGSGGLGASAALGTGTGAGGEGTGGEDAGWAGAGAVLFTSAGFTSVRTTTLFLGALAS
jgi:radical SAM superfamily enzyme YgiQ (UPF0313 family)